MTPRLKSWLANAALVAASLLVGAAAIEGVIAYALSHPEILASSDGSVGRPLALARNYYMRKDRRIVQYLADCAVWDPEVTYTLKPGARCVVANREHAVEYAANRAGLRDDDAALADPRIVVLGDSHAIGWGVAAGETFAKALGRDLGMVVLNAAMSSYGTARELALYQRLKLDGVKALVIQYCDNDYEENQRLAARGSLDITPEARYRRLVLEQARDTRYYPFKHVRNLFSIGRLALPWRKLPAPPADSNVLEARAFLDVLLHYRELVAGTPIVVLELNEHNRNDRRFVDAAALLLHEPRYAALKPLLSLVDVAPLLAPADYYVLDDHMRPSGHAKVARAIAAELRRRGVAAP
ncbi:MAG: hypothetical protein L6R19_12215 [Alphaproteobacteria bacterium]|nr:hypothetical protein [Alphaproteobacteria bacterium]